MLRFLTGFSLLFTAAMLLACGSAPAAAPEPVLPAHSPVPTATRAPTATPAPPTTIPTATPEPTATLPPPTIAPTATPAPTATLAPTSPATPDISSIGNGRYPAALGMQAPTFTLPSGNGPVIDLASYTGKKNVVLVFYRTHT